MAAVSADEVDLRWASQKLEARTDQLNRTGLFSAYA